MYFLASMRAVGLRYKIWLVSIVVVSQAATFIYFKVLEERYYRANFSISSQLLTRRYINGEIDNLNLLCKDKTRKGLAAILHISEEMAQKIHRFGFKDFTTEEEEMKLEVLREKLRALKVNELSAEQKDMIDNVVSRMGDAEANSYEIFAQVYDPAVGKQVLDAVYKYIRSQDFISNRIKVDSVILTNRKAKLMSESRKLDSLKAVLYQNFLNMSKQTSQGSNNVILSDRYLTNPIEVFKQDITYGQQIDEIDRIILLRTNFETTKSYEVILIPDNPRISFLSPVALLLSLLGFFLIVGVIKLNRYLATVNV